MSGTSGYGQFCPVAMASEIICTRWTMLILRELCAGSTRFNELRRGVDRSLDDWLSGLLRLRIPLGPLVVRCGDRRDVGLPGRIESRKDPRSDLLGACRLGGIHG